MKQSKKLKPETLETYKEKKRTKKGLMKCRRCKQEVKKIKGSRICKICKTRCSACGIKLNPDNIDRYCLEKRKAYRCKKCVAQCVRETTDPVNNADYKLQRNYGISLEEYNKILESQGGTCGVCRRLPQKIRLSVDHKHLKGERQIKREGGQAIIRALVRGILCWQCNTALGKFNDDPELLERAADYLRNHNAQKLLQKG
jgi:hypothetical protein